jgi:hypothetical protein
LKKVQGKKKSEKSKEDAIREKLQGEAHAAQTVTISGVDKPGQSIMAEFQEDEDIIFK